MPGVEVVRVSVPDDVQGDVDIVAGHQYPSSCLQNRHNLIMKLCPFLASPVNRDVHDPVVIIELSLGALAVVHVPVHDQYPLQPSLESFARS